LAEDDMLLHGPSFLSVIDYYELTRGERY